MSITWEIRKLPSGHEYVYILTSGVATGEEAFALRKVVGAGAPYEGMPIISFIVPGSSFSPEARRNLGTIGEGTTRKTSPMTAIVVSNTAVRVTLGFVLRVSRSSSFVRLVGTEAEALSWLQNQVKDLPIDFHKSDTYGLPVPPSDARGS
jgi:hypothetical protein